MSRGILTVRAPHFCGETIIVAIHWSSSPGSYWNPPDHDEEWLCYDQEENDITRCPKCGVDLDWDDIFHTTVTKIGVIVLHQSRGMVHLPIRALILGLDLSHVPRLHVRVLDCGL